MIIERLSQEHRNIEKLLAILERELEVFDRGDRPDYEVIRAVISYFEVYQICNLIQDTLPTAYRRAWIG
jgi:hemerythrin-like domain-containing protein